MSKFSLKELNEALAVKSKALKMIFEEAGPDLDMKLVKSLEGDTKAKVEKLQALNRELDDLAGERETLLAIEKKRQGAADMDRLMNQPGGKLALPGGDPGKAEVKSLGQVIMEVKGQLRPNGPSVEVPFDVKTLFETGAGWSPQSVRIPRVELYPARPIAVVDRIPQIPTTQAAVVYMEETTATFNAVEKAEAAAYAESQFALTERTVTVRKITTSLPVTDEQLADVPAAEAYLNNRLVYDIKRRLDLQVLEGNDQAPNLKGTLNIGGSLQTQALGSDPVPDAIYKLFDKIRTVGFTEPSDLFINANDWQPVRLLRTADGIYIWGSPQDAGPLRIWGVPVTVTQAVTANTAIAGDYATFSALYTRTGLEVSMGYVNDDFTKGKKTIRADIRVAMVHFRTAAFGTITGI